MKKILYLVIVSLVASSCQVFVVDEFVKKITPVFNYQMASYPVLQSANQWVLPMAKTSLVPDSVLSCSNVLNTETILVHVGPDGQLLKELPFANQSELKNFYNFSSSKEGNLLAAQIAFLNSTKMQFKEFDPTYQLTNSYTINFPYLGENQIIEFYEPGHFTLATKLNNNVHVYEIKDGEIAIKSKVEFPYPGNVIKTFKAKSGAFWLWIYDSASQKYKLLTLTKDFALESMMAFNSINLAYIGFSDALGPFYVDYIYGQKTGKVVIPFAKENNTDTPFELNPSAEYFSLSYEVIQSKAYLFLDELRQRKVYEITEGGQLKFITQFEQFGKMYQTSDGLLIQLGIFDDYAAKKHALAYQNIGKKNTPITELIKGVYFNNRCYTW